MSNQADLSAAEEAFRDASRTLLAALEETVGPWIERCVTNLVTAWEGNCGPEAQEQGRSAGDEATRFVTSGLAWLAEPINAPAVQPPLEVLRAASMFATKVLASRNVPPVVRDDFSEKNFPTDHYDLNPLNLTDIDPTLGELALVWGASRANLHLAQRRAAQEPN